MISRELEFKVGYMHREAVARLHDAATLGSTFGTHSDSGSLLRLLAFEIFLKATVLIHGTEPPKTHSYRDLFGLLPAAVQAGIVRAAHATRQDADLSDLPRILETLSKNFNRLRYPYETYAGWTEEQWVAAGDDWISRGAPLDEASFVYYPAELNGLTHGLQLEVEEWLKVQETDEENLDE